jgi:DNA gyrase/topoisomerase IV subunit B
MGKRISLAEHIRRRSGMYIGRLSDPGLRWITTAIVSEILGRPAAKIHHVRLFVDAERDLRFEFDGIIPGLAAQECEADQLIVEDRGRFGEQNQEPAVMFSDLAVASAICERLHFECIQQGHFERQSFSRGLQISSCEHGPLDIPPSLKLDLRFDSELFPAWAKISYLSMCGQLQELAIFHPSITFSLQDARTSMRRDYRYENGLLSYLQEVDYHWFDSAPPNPQGYIRALYHLKLGDGSELRRGGRLRIALLPAGSGFFIRQWCSHQRQRYPC